MILLDTHIWVWWMNKDARLSAAHRQAIRDQEPIGLGVSVISCWEIAQLVERGRLKFKVPVLEWVEDALTHPAVSLLALTARIAVESTQLPDWPHRDPADRFIVATARAHDCALMTIDGTILSYPHVRTV